MRNKQSEEQESWFRAMEQRDILAQQPTRPIVMRGRRRWLVPGLLALLVVFAGLAVFVAPPLVQRWSAVRPTPDAGLQSILHPETTISYSTAISGTANIFMQNMQQENWPALWSMLAPDARHNWKDEQDFIHFEQTKFGKLSLQGYTLGQATISHPWLDPDTTRVYNSAATMQITLQAAAPSGLLTAPSDRALKQGLFKQTLFAVVQDQQKNWQVLVAGPADPEAPVLVPAKAPVSHLLIPIFMYHHVSSLPAKDQFDFNLTVTTADFNAQLNWLQKQGYHAITMTELFDAFYDGKALPAKPMILTFDDGYSDIYTYALPALLAHHVRGVFYIITGMIGGRYMSWDEVRALARSGMQIASHTIHHVNVGEPPYGMTTQGELLDSKLKLEARLNEPIQFFCYPTGEPFHHDSLAERKTVLKDLFDDGYLGATLDPAAFDSTLQNSQTPYQLPRVRVSGGENLATFEGILAATFQADAVRLKGLSSWKG